MWLDCVQFWLLLFENKITNYAYLLNNMLCFLFLLKLKLKIKLYNLINHQNREVKLRAAMKCQRNDNKKLIIAEQIIIKLQTPAPPSMLPSPQLEPSPILHTAPISQNIRPDIQIYLRRSNKKGVKITLQHSQSTLIHLFQIAEKEFKITRQEMLLCIKGKEYMYESLWDYEQHQYQDRHIKLANLTIVHVHDLKLHKELSIILQCLWLGRDSDSIQYSVSCNTKVVEVLDLYRKEIISTNGQDIVEFKLVQSGRIISVQKTFEQLYIQDKATIHILPLKIKSKSLEKKQLTQNYEQKQQIEEEGESNIVENQILKKQQQEDDEQDDHEEERDQVANTTEEEVEKDLQKIFDDDQDEEPVVRQRVRPRSFQRSFVCLGASTDNLFQQLEQRNFKKKKALCLKSVHTNPQDSDHYIWRPDSSDRYSNDQNKLAKFIRCKRKRTKKQEKSLFSKQKTNKKEQESSQKPAKKLSMSARHKLKQQFQRLFQSDTLGLKINSHSGNSSNHKPKQIEQNKAQKNHDPLDIEESEQIVFESQLSVI